MNITTQEAVDRFEEIRDEISELMDEALRLYASHGGMEERGRCYWYAHVLGALGGDYGSEFLGGCLIDMQSALEEMKENG
jgi:hypothetical protein